MNSIIYTGDTLAVEDAVYKFVNQYHGGADWKWNDAACSTFSLVGGSQVYCIRYVPTG
jgi:hypothetical protein